MANKSVNQIWKEFAEKKGISFKEWFGVEKHYYDKRNPNIDIENWLNKRYAMVKDEFLNFDWNNIKDFLNDNKDEIIIGAGALAGDETPVGDDTPPTTPPVAPPKSKTILGMPKYLAIGIGVVAAAGITFGIIKIVKSVKK